MMSACVHLCVCACVRGLVVYAHVGKTAHSIKANMCHCAKRELVEGTGVRHKSELYL